MELYIEAFMTEGSQTLSGYQPHQLVKQHTNQHFENHLHSCISSLMTKKKMVVETMVHLLFNHPIQVVAPESFTEL